jgi:hypothetical protein
LAVVAVDFTAVLAALAVAAAPLLAAFVVLVAPDLAVVAVFAVDLRAVVAVALAAGVVFLAAGFRAGGEDLEVADGARLAGGIWAPVASSRGVAAEATRSPRQVTEFAGFLLQ